MKAGRMFDIIFGASYPLLVVSALLWNMQGKHIGGTAIGGKIEAGQYFVSGASAGTFHIVTGGQWFLSLLLTCLTLLLCLLAGCGFWYFGTEYFLYPSIQSRRKGNTL